MATRTVKARVEIDGEKQYKAALSDLNKGNQVLASEMRKLQAQFKGNESSTEALAAKGEVLERQLLQQKDKVQTLRDALANAAKEYGEADKRTQDWQIKLNQAEAAQYDLEHAIEDNNKALGESTQLMEAQGRELVGLGDGLDQLAGKLGVKIPDAAKNALNSMGDFSAGTVAKMAAVAGAVAAAIKAVQQLNQITLEAAARADELITESMQTGLSTDTIQKFKYAENLIDVSYSTISSSLTKLTQNMDKARDGNEDLAAAFAALSVSITDSTGQLRPAEDVFLDVVDALGQVGNATERDAASMELFGKSAQDLNPLFIQGTGTLRGFFDEAERGGYVLDESQIAKLAQVDDAYQRMQLSIEATKNELAVQFAPASEQAMQLFADMASQAGDALVDSEIIDNLVVVIEKLFGMFGAIDDLIAQIPGFNGVLDLLSKSLQVVGNIIDTVARGLQSVVSLMKGDFSSIGQIWSGYGAQWSRLLPGNNASGNDNWRGGLTYLNESGPELALLPSGTRILNAQDTRSAGGNVFYVTIDAKNVREFNDIVALAESARIRGRMA